MKSDEGREEQYRKAVYQEAGVSEELLITDAAELLRLLAPNARTEAERKNLLERAEQIDERLK